MPVPRPFALVTKSLPEDTVLPLAKPLLPVRIQVPVPLLVRARLLGEVPLLIEPLTVLGVVEVPLRTRPRPVAPALIVPDMVRVPASLPIVVDPRPVRTLTLPLISLLPDLLRMPAPEFVAVLKAMADGSVREPPAPGSRRSSRFAAMPLPPLRFTVLLLVPRALPLVIRRIPELMLTVPERVLLPDRVRMPVLLRPVLIRPALPVRTDEIVAPTLLAVVMVGVVPFRVRVPPLTM